MAAQEAWTLIGDLVGSKGTSDRYELQRELDVVLRKVTASLDPLQPLRPTVGDEFQGAFSSVQEAVKATLILRLELLERGSVDSRYGLGFGVINVFPETSPEIQDGPGWWSARASIDRAKELAGSPRTSFARTGFGYWAANPAKWAPLPDASGVNAFLISRDAIVSQMSGRSRRLLLGLMLGRSQSQLADEEGITQSAISQNLARSGAFAVQAAQQAFEEGRQP